MGFNPIVDTVNQLVDIDTAKAFVGAKSDDADQENMLKFYINTASEFCNVETHRLLKSRTLTEYYSGDGSNTLLVDQYPITTLTSVYDDPARAYGADTLIDSGDLVIMPEGLACKIIYDGGVFISGVKNLKVTYIAGYITIPYNLQQACLELIAYFFKNSDENRFGVVSRTVGDGSLTVETTDIPKSALRTLREYKKKW